MKCSSCEEHIDKRRYYWVLTRAGEAPIFFCFDCVSVGVETIPSKAWDEFYEKKVRPIYDSGE